MSQPDLTALIESALREPDKFVARKSINEPAIAWQARAVRAALEEKGQLK